MFSGKGWFPNSGEMKEYELRGKWGTTEENSGLSRFLPLLGNPL